MRFQINKEKILIIDFGSQVTKLIARRVRELGVYSEIIVPQRINDIKNFDLVKGIILSGGPSTVTKKNFQTVPKDIFSKKIPILGICYGLQLIAKALDEQTILNIALTMEKAINFKNSIDRWWEK